MPAILPATELKIRMRPPPALRMWGKTILVASMVPNTLHPKLQFTQEELDALTAYLLTLGAPANYTAEAPILFKKNCSSCHTINGQGGTEGPDLSTVGSRRSTSFLEPFISDPRSVVPDASMPAFHNVLTPEQIKDIAAYLSSLKGQSSPTTPSP